MIALLTTDIGRGHPFYLDGVRQVLAHRGRTQAVAASDSVFELARGPSALVWRAIRAAYVAAGRGGAIADVYLRTRRAAVPSESSPLHTLLGAQLRPWAARFEHVLVDHPVLVAALRGHRGIWYQHGEHATPPEAVAPGAARTFVPTERSAEVFAAQGYPRDRLTVTGLCIEPELEREAESAMAKRRDRLKAGGPLTVAFFSSGAEPPGHVEALVAGAHSVVAAGHRAIVFAKRGGRLEQNLGRARPLGLECASFDGRAELDRVTAARFPAFDAFASPPHERTQWALGLGLPMFLVGPDIGPFSPLNRAVLREAGVAFELSDPTAARGLGMRLGQLRASGGLVALAEKGWGRPIDGFAVVASAVEAAAAEQRSRVVN